MRYSFIIKILFIPFYCIAVIIPKNNNIWVFGSGNGRKYNDNSKSLYEYILNNKKNIKPIWITKSNIIFHKLKSDNKEVYKFYSLKGVYYTLIARVFIISHSFDDVSWISYLFPYRIKIIQLWHGTPLKKLVVSGFQESDLKKKFLLFWLLKFIGRDADLMISANEKSVVIYKEIANFNKVVVTGQPRNDLLFSKNFLKSKQNVLLYLPTWREEKNGFDYFFQYGFDVKKISKFLEDKNSILLIKFHSVVENSELVNYFRNKGNIILINDDDIYEVLPKVDILLTDYSSVYFDFLLLNRPIIFTPFDYDTYSSRWGFYYDYNEVTPGPKANNWNEVLRCVSDLLSGSDNYCKERRVICKEFNQYMDGNSSERVFQEIIKLFK